MKDGRRIHQIALPRGRSADRFADVIQHEVSHAIEYHAEAVSKASHAFRAEVGTRSMGTLKRAKMQTLVPGAGYRKDEEAIVGGFLDPYVGKDYDFHWRGATTERPGTEIVTMGMEKLYRLESVATPGVGVRSRFRRGHFDHFALVDWVVEVAIRRGRAFVP